MTTCISALVPADPPLPVLSVLFDGTGSVSSALTVVLLSNAPLALMVALTVMVSLLPLVNDGMVQGKAEQLVELTVLMVKLVGVSVT